MQQYSIKLTEYAEKDLKQIAEYLQEETRNPYAAEKFVKDIRTQLKSLSTFPARHQLVEDAVLREYGVHRMSYKGYSVFYLVDNTGNRVYIIRILHRTTDFRIRLYHFFKTDTKRIN